MGLVFRCSRHGLFPHRRSPDCPAGILPPFPVIFINHILDPRRIGRARRIIPDPYPALRAVRPFRRQQDYGTASFILPRHILIKRPFRIQGCLQDHRTGAGNRFRRVPAVSRQSACHSQDNVAAVQLQSFHTSCSMIQNLERHRYLAVAIYRSVIRRCLRIGRRRHHGPFPVHFRANGFRVPAVRLRSQLFRQDILYKVPGQIRQYLRVPLRISAVRDQGEQTAVINRPPDRLIGNAARLIMFAVNIYGLDRNRMILRPVDISGNQHASVIAHLRHDIRILPVS